MTEHLPVPVAPADLSLSLDRAKAYAGAADHEAVCSLSKIDIQADIEAASRLASGPDRLSDVDKC